MPLTPIYTSDLKQNILINLKSRVIQVCCLYQLRKDDSTLRYRRESVGDACTVDYLIWKMRTVEYLDSHGGVEETGDGVIIETTMHIPSRFLHLKDTTEFQELFDVSIMSLMWWSSVDVDHD